MIRRAYAGTVKLGLSRRQTRGFSRENQAPKGLEVQPPLVSSKHGPRAGNGQDSFDFRCTVAATRFAEPPGGGHRGALGSACAALSTAVAVTWARQGAFSASTPCELRRYRRGGAMSRRPRYPTARRGPTASPPRVPAGGGAATGLLVASSPSCCSRTCRPNPGRQQDPAPRLS